MTVKRQLSEASKSMRGGGASVIESMERLTEAGVNALMRPGGSDPSADMMLRLGVAPTETSALWNELTPMGSASGGLARVTDYGSGQILASVKRALLDAAVPGKIDALRAQVTAQRGYLVVQAAPPELRTRLPSWGDMGGEAALLRLLKAKFDPGAILAPGRFIS